MHAWHMWAILPRARGWLTFPFLPSGQSAIFMLVCQDMDTLGGSLLLIQLSIRPHQSPWRPTLLCLATQAPASSARDRPSHLDCAPHLLCPPPRSAWWWRTDPCSCVSGRVRYWVTPTHTPILVVGVWRHCAPHTRGTSNYGGFRKLFASTRGVHSPPQFFHQS